MVKRALVGASPPAAAVAKKRRLEAEGVEAAVPAVAAKSVVAADAPAKATGSDDGGAPPVAAAGADRKAAAEREADRDAAAAARAATDGAADAVGAAEAASVSTGFTFGGITKGGFGSATSSSTASIFGSFGASSAAFGDSAAFGSGEAFGNDLTAYTSSAVVSSVFGSGASAGSGSIFGSSSGADGSATAKGDGATDDAASASGGSTHAAASAAPSWVKPAAPLRSGEETEDYALRVRCRLFELLTNKWVERGVGFLRINLSAAGESAAGKSTAGESATARIVMRSEKVLKVILNAVRPLFAFALLALSALGRRRGAGCGRGPSSLPFLSHHPLPPSPPLAQSLFPQMHCIRAGEREARLTALVFAGRKSGQAGGTTPDGASSCSSAAEAAATPATTATADEASAAGDASDAAGDAVDGARIQTFLVRFRESAQVDQFIRCVDAHKG